MKKCKLIFLPLFCLLLAGCGNSSQPGGDTPGGGETPAVVNDASLSLAENSMRVDETFTLNVLNIPKGVTPSWSKEGNAITYETNTAKTSAVVTAVEVGNATIKVVVGEKNLTCEITVSDSPVQRTPLETPVLTVNADKNGLTWGAVEGAEGYLIQINDGEIMPQTNIGYLFSQTAGTYSVKVTTKADIAEYNSVPAVYDYETKIASVGELSFVNNNAITAASYVGIGLEAKLGSGEYAPVNNQTLNVTADGTYTFHAKGGYDEVKNFFYVEGADAVKEIEVVRLVKLSAPVVDVNDDENGLVWEAVSGAVNYSIKVNEEPATLSENCKYAFATEAGNYHVEIIAKASVAEFDSDKVEFDYEVKLSSLGALSFSNNKVTWASVEGFGVEAKVGDGNYFDVEPTGLEVYYNYGGNYTFHAIGGFDPDDSVYYVDTDDSTKTINIVPEKVIVEDGHDTNNTDLMDRYYVEKYGSNGWEPTANPKIYLDSAINEGITPGRCARIHYWANSIAYRYSQEIRFVKSYDTVSFFAKGSGDDTYIIVRLIVTKQLSFHGISLTGVSMTFRVNDPSINWTKHTFDIDDDSVQINYGGQNYTPSKIIEVLNSVAGVELTSVGELLQYFDTCAFIVSGSTTNGAERDVYVDEVVFSNDHGETEHKEYVPEPVLKEKYSMTTDAVHGQIKVIDNEHAEATILKDGAAATIPVTLAMDENKLTVTSVVPDNDFVLVVSSIDAGASWTYISCTGTLAPAMANAKFGELLVLDDFTSYSSTGVGYDKTHTIDQISGLRANYYCDYYDQFNTDGVQSPVGGSNWWLMGSDNYLNYVSTGCFDSGSATLRSSTSYRNMRYMSIALAGEATPFAKGFKTMSFMVKGSETRDVKIKAYAYYGSSLTPATQLSNRTDMSSDWVTVAKDSGWTEYKITLNASRAYCGFCIILQAGTGSDAAFISIDNIVMYK